jgi:hypothetical protein
VGGIHRATRLGARQLRSALTMLGLIIGAVAEAGSDRHRRATECTRGRLRHLIAARPVGGTHDMSDGNLG